MRELVKEFRKLMIIFTVVVAIITYFSIYLPIKNELRDRTLENFILASQQGEQLIDFFIIQCMDNTESISNKTVLKHELVKYISGEISREEARKFTARIYSENLTELKNVKAAFRMVEGTILNTYNPDLLEDVPKVPMVSKLYYEINLDGDGISILVYSPIIIQDEIVGYDAVLYDLSDIIKNLNKEHLEISIINTDEANRIMELNIKERKTRDIIVKDDGIHTYYVNKIEDHDRYYYVKIDDKLLYQSIRDVSYKNIIIFMISILSLVLFTNGITMRVAQRVLLKAEKSTAKYKEYATRDALTGAYSRFFFDRLMKEQQKKEEMKDNFLTVVMIDIDDFKKINDTYGHNMGDKAVIEVVNTLRSSLRENDYVIRYGGDEFLLLMKNLEENVVETILQRIVERLKNLSELDFPISISYGIQESRDIKQIHKAIEQADEKMYISKKKKQKERESYLKME